MKNIKVGLVVMGLFAAAITQAQTVDSIIARHIAAIGGREKMKSITSMKIETTTAIMGNENAATITILNGKGYKMETSFNGQDIVSALTDKGGWGINPMAGSTDAQDMPEEQYNASKDQINIGSPFINYPANGYKVVLDGTDTIAGIKAYKLKLTTPSGVTVTDYIDPTTYYLMKTVIAADDKETTITYSDYRKTDFGYVMAYSLETALPQGFTISSTITKVTFNEPVDAKIFAKP